MKAKLMQVELEAEKKLADGAFDIPEPEAEDDIDENRHRIKKIKYYSEFCQNIKEFGFCEDKKNCQKAHRPQELDLVSINRKIKQLKSGIGACVEKLGKSEPYKPWRNTGPKVRKFKNLTIIGHYGERSKDIDGRRLDKEEEKTRRRE